MKYKFINAFLFIITFIFWTGFACANEKSEVKKLKNPILIDVRTQAEFDVAHIKGAILIPYDQIKNKIAEFVKDKNTEIALYCRTGRRSGIATTILKELGYQNVENYGSMQNATNLLNK